MATAFSKLIFTFNPQNNNVNPTNINVISSSKIFQQTACIHHLQSNSILIRARKMLFLGKSRRENTSIESAMVASGSDDHPRPFEGQKVSEKWREIHGETEWKGMLDPIDPLLRSELIRYGEMAQACYDGFDHDPYSKYGGSCKIRPGDFFEVLGLAKLGYSVTHYLHGPYDTKLPRFFIKSLKNQWSPVANWMGYVAVSDDEASARLGRRDIAIAWRGSATGPEMIADLLSDITLKPVSSVKIPCPDPRFKIQSSLVQIYTNKEEKCPFCKNSLREQILTEIEQLKHRYENEELSITVTGHGLGSSLAILNAYDIAETRTNVTEDTRVVPVCVFSFSGPRVGNLEFRNRLENLGVNVLRVVNVHDKVPTVPGVFLNEKKPLAWQKLLEDFPYFYSHVGAELSLDHNKSPFLKKSIDAGCMHNLELLTVFLK